MTSKFSSLWFNSFLKKISMSWSLSSSLNTHLAWNIQIISFCYNCNVKKYSLKIQEAISKTTESILGLFVLIWMFFPHTESKCDNNNLNFKQFWKMKKQKQKYKFENVDQSSALDTCEGARVYTIQLFLFFQLKYFKQNDSTSDKTRIYNIHLLCSFDWNILNTMMWHNQGKKESHVVYLYSYWQLILLACLICSLLITT